MTPPEKLRTELERLRDRGYSFKQAWRPAVTAALRDENAHVAVFWRRAWREQRPIWAVSYSRAPWPANQRPALSGVDNDRSGQAVPAPAAVFA